MSLSNFRILGRRKHAKASEAYVDVEFSYPDSARPWSGSVPTEYPKAGIHATTEAEVQELVATAYDAMRPSNRGSWLEKEKAFWDQSDKQVTRPFFDALSDFEWKCTAHALPPNPNPARRIQDIKDMGYTLATNPKLFCPSCGKATAHYLLLAIPRAFERRYETFSPRLKARILRVLDSYDAYEGKPGGHLLPDHKFPEVRWDVETREENPDNMTDEEIRSKFQLLSNQRNEQKREVCRTCLQTGRRGTPFGIKYFYEGGENWPEGVPRTGKEAEQGCVGCGWYDLEAWRKALVNAAGSA